MFDDDIRDEVLEYFVDKIFVYDDRIIVTGPYFEGIAEQVSFEELADDTIEFDSFAIGSTTPETPFDTYVSIRCFVFYTLKALRRSASSFHIIAVCFAGLKKRGFDPLQ